MLQTSSVSTPLPLKTPLCQVCFPGYPELYVLFTMTLPHT